MDIEDIIEEKYTNWLNCETDELDLTIEEAKHILVNDKKQRYVDDLLEEAWKVVLSELEKKDKVINEMAECIGQDIRCVRPEIECNKMTHDCTECVKQYYFNKVEREGK